MKLALVAVDSRVHNCMVPFKGSYWVEVSDWKCRECGKHLINAGREEFVVDGDVTKAKAFCQRGHWAGTLVLDLTPAPPPVIESAPFLLEPDDDEPEEEDDDDPDTGELLPSPIYEPEGF